MYSQSLYKDNINSIKDSLVEWVNFNGNYESKDVLKSKAWEYYKEWFSEKQIEEMIKINIEVMPTILEELDWLTITMIEASSLNSYDALIYFKSFKMLRESGYKKEEIIVQLSDELGFDRTEYIWWIKKMYKQVFWVGIFDNKEKPDSDLFLKTIFPRIIWITVWSMIILYISTLLLQFIYYKWIIYIAYGDKLPE